MSISLCGWFEKSPSSLDGQGFDAALLYDVSLRIPLMMNGRAGGS